MRERWLLEVIQGRGLDRTPGPLDPLGGAASGLFLALLRDRFTAEVAGGVAPEIPVASGGGHAQEAVAPLEHSVIH